MKKLLCLLTAAIILASSLISCSSPVPYDRIDLSKVSIDKVSESDKETDYVIITVKDYGKIVIRLFPDVAPETVKNFKDLVSKKFYDGVIFHRIIEDFMIQGGAPTSGTKKPASIRGEFSENGFENNLKHTRGVVSMARAQDMNSASSQFFICQRDYSYGDGKYAAFGFVVNGMSVVDAIAAVKVNSANKPYTDVVVESIRFASVAD